MPFPQYPHISHVQAKLPGLHESAPSADIVKRPFPPPRANAGDTLAVQVQKLILTSVFLCPLSPHLILALPPPLIKHLTFCQLRLAKKLHETSSEEEKQNKVGWFRLRFTITVQQKDTIISTLLLPSREQFCSHLNADFIKPGRAIPRETCSGRAKRSLQQHDKSARSSKNQTIFKCSRSQRAGRH